jgi:hypothetical protein
MSTVWRWTYLLLCLSLVSRGQGLVWDQQTIEFKPKPGDTQATATFTFTNKGDRTLHVRRVRTSCGCTAAKMNKEDYKPGEKGKLSVTFRFDGRTGKQMKTIFVTTDDPDMPTTHVDFVGMLPWNVQLSETLLLWGTGTEPKPQQVLLEFAPTEDIELVKVELDSNAFSCKVEKTDVEKQLRLVFVPKDTSERTRAIATLKTKPGLSQAESARSRIFLYVR